MKFAFIKWFFLLVLIFLPLYLFRLKQTPEYQIPEQTKTRLIGRVSEQPHLKGSNQIIRVGPIFISTERFPGYFYGQKIEVFGEFKKQVINPFQVQYWAYYPEIRLIEEEETLLASTKWRQTLFKIRGQLEGLVNQFFSEPEASLLNGILLGTKKEMPQQFWQKLRKTGTIHVVVASGYNLLVVTEVLVLTLTWVLSRKKALFFALLGVIGYTLMVGAEPPVVRAAIMAGLAFTAQVWGKQEEALITLLIAAAAMLLISPLILFDIGFQLSFAATGGMLFLTPLFKAWGRIFGWPAVGDDLAATLAAQIGVTPIILLNFGSVSFLSPLVNALVLSVVPIIMNLGAITILLGLILKPLGQILAWFTWVLLKYFVIIVEIFSRLPWSELEIKSLSFWWGASYYLALGFIIFLVTRCPKKPRSPKIGTIGGKE